MQRSSKQPKKINNPLQQMRQNQEQQTEELRRVGRNSKINYSRRTASPSKLAIVSTALVLNALWIAATAQEIDLPEEKIRVGKEKKSNADTNTLTKADPKANNTAIRTEEPTTNFVTTPQQQKLHLEQIRDKIKIDSRVADKDFNRIKQNCDNDVVHKIIEATKDEHHGHITRVFNNPVFKAFACTDDPIADAEPQNSADTKLLAFFREDFILARADKTIVDVTTIKHECLHADAYLRHTNHLCKAAPNDAASPIYPVTQENIDKFNKAFDEGDKRIKEFEGLWLKKQNNLPLTKNEKIKLKDYVAACEGVQSYEDYYLINEDQYLAMKKTLQEQAGKPLEASLASKQGKNFGKIHFNAVEKRGEKYLSVFTFTQPEQVVIHLLYHIKSLLDTPLYKTKSEVHKLAEREAFTFATLTPKAAMKFYPEAYQLREEDVKRCTLHI